MPRPHEEVAGLTIHVRPLCAPVALSRVRREVERGGWAYLSGCHAATAAVVVVVVATMGSNTITYHDPWSPSAARARQVK